MQSRDSSRQRLGRFVIAAILAVVSLVLAPSAFGAAVGVNSDITWGITPAQVNQEVSLTVNARIKWIRASVDLSDAEPSAAGQLDANYIAQIDSEIQAARNAGLNVLMEFDRTPYWASADPAKYSDASGLHWNHYYRYSNVQDYANIVGALVAHYRTLGVHAYELWNEPNLVNFWPSGPDAVQYTQLLKAAFPAVKAADPESTVVMGGLSNKGSYSFLQGMYAAGARGSYDVANFHIYPEGDPTQCLMVNGRPYEGSFCLLSGLRSEMAANGDSAPVWVTEIGWSTCTQESPCFTEQQQASYVTSAYKLLATSAYAWVQAAFVYQMRDVYWDTSSADWGGSLGLLRRDFTPKPAYYALQAIASATVPASPAPPSAPSVTLTAPTPGTVAGSSITAAANASDPSGISKVTFSIDGKVVATDSSAPYAANLSTKKLPNGSHTVTATAYDAAGASASASASIYKGTPTATAAAARSARLTVTLGVRRFGGHTHVVATGTVRVGAPAPSHVSGRIVLVQQRFSRGHWNTTGTANTMVKRGRYTRNLRLTHGLWRIRATFQGVASSFALIRVH